MLETWRQVWRDGFVPVLSTPALTKLKEALARDDPRLLQAATTKPPPNWNSYDMKVEAACAIGFCGWQGDGEERAEGKIVRSVELFFANACHEADQRLGVPSACRYFLNWFDDTDRQEMRKELLAEVELALASRATEGSAEEKTDGVQEDR